MSTLFQLLVFLLPTQFGYHFWPGWSYVFGIRVDYLSPTIYLTDLIFLALLGFFAKEFLKKSGGVPKSFILGAVGLFAFAAANIFLSLSVPVSTVRWLKILELFLLAAVVVKAKGFDFKTWVIKPLALSVIFFSVIGIIQVLLGGTVGGPLYFLGERSFFVSTPGIAVISLFGRDFLRAYSTFSHPNSLAGFLGIAVFLVFFLYPKGKSWLKRLAVVLGGLCFLLTFSLAAVLSAGVALLFYGLRRKRFFAKLVVLLLWLSIIFSLSLPLFSRGLATKLGKSESPVRRLNLAEAAGRIISQKPFFGTGANNFVVVLPKASYYPAVSWWLQPVHNLYLLVFSETGILGLLIFLYLLYSAISRTLFRKNPLVFPLIFVVLTGILDHYWLTLQQNQLLLALLLGVSFRKAKA